MGHRVLSPDWMITMKLLSSVFTSTEVLSADICFISVPLAALNSLKIVRDWGGGGGGGGRSHVITKAPCHVMLFWSLVRWSGAIWILTGIVNAVSLWEMASGAGRACDILLNFTWWKRRGSLLFCFIYAFPFPPQRTSLTPKCAYTPTCFHFRCLIKPTMPHSTILP